MPKLINSKNGQELSIGDKVVSIAGEQCRIRDITLPSIEKSMGRVLVDCYDIGGGIKTYNCIPNYVGATFNS